MSLYVQMIEEVYREKKMYNPQFSLNSYAAFLGMSASQLNEVLQGKCGISEARSLKLADKMGLSDFQKRLFCLSVESLHSRSKKRRVLAGQELESLSKNMSEVLELEKFSLVSGWYHFAILELMNLDDFEQNIKWISKKISVDRALVQVAVDRLIKLSLIKIVNGKWMRSKGMIETTSDVPSLAIKKYHCQVLKLAEQAIYHVPIKKREFKSVFLSVDEDEIPQLKQRIRNFQDELVCEYTTKSKRKNKLICLNTQMFPLNE